jgi:hypothetical protein
VVDKVDTKSNIRKALAQLPFEERRVIIDQSNKFLGDLNNIIAVDGGAIAGEWHSSYRQRGYNYREDHKERDSKFYMIPNNWALQKGFVKAMGGQWIDRITRVGEEIFCRCSMRFVYNIRDLPSEMITKKGEEELTRVRAVIKSRFSAT